MYTETYIVVPIYKKPGSMSSHFHSATRSLQVFSSSTSKLVDGVVVPCDEGNRDPCHHHTESFKIIGSTIRNCKVDN